MGDTEQLEKSRAALQMINPTPYNAEAPREALQGEITPTDFHYVRSNFAIPEHDGTFTIGGAVENPITLSLADLRALPAIERTVTLECAGNGRLEMRPLPTGEPWGDYAVSTARWTGARLSDVLALARPTSDGVDVRFEGADSGSYLLHPVLASTDGEDLTFVRALSLSLAADPATEILLAYEMNGEPLRPDHGAPFRVVVPHWFAVASVKWLHRIDILTEPYTGEFQTGHYIYEWPDRPHEPCAYARGSPNPLPERSCPPSRALSVARRGRGAARSPTSMSASRGKASGTRPRSNRPRAPTSGRTGPSSGTRRIADDTRFEREPPTLPATFSPKCHRGTGWAMATMR